METPDNARSRAARLLHAYSSAPLADPHGEFVAAAFVDGKRLGEVAIRGITDIVEIIRRERVLPKDHGTRRELWLDQPEHRQIERPCTVDQKHIPLAADVVECFQRITFAD